MVLPQGALSVLRCESCNRALGAVVSLKGSYGNGVG